MEPVAPAEPLDTTMDASPPRRRSVAEMLGETFREAGLLLAVFIPLDLFVQGHPLTIWSIVAIVVLPAVLLTSGILLERRRRQ
jgi:hypothetical protein